MACRPWWVAEPLETEAAARAAVKGRIKPGLKVGFVFFGITRALRLTLPAIVDNLIAPARALGGEVRLFGHFYSQTAIENARSGESGDLDPEAAKREIPTLAMMTAAPATLAGKARKLAGLLKKALAGRYTVTTVAGASRVGGGAFPEHDLPTTLVALTPLAGAPAAEALRQRLLATDPPLVGRIEDGAFLLDPRTLADDELRLAATVLGQALGEGAGQAVRTHPCPGSGSGRSPDVPG